MTIPGIGLLIATALVAFVGDIHRFPSARHFASYLGLTPRENSSGLRRRLGASPREVTSTCARSSSTALAPSSSPPSAAARPSPRLGPRTTDPRHNKAATALANKLARIVWAVWKHERPFSRHVTRLEHHLNDYDPTSHPGCNGSVDGCEQVGPAHGHAENKDAPVEAVSSDWHRARVRPSWPGAHYRPTQEAGDTTAVRSLEPTTAYGFRLFLTEESRYPCSTAPPPPSFVYGSAVQPAAIQPPSTREVLPHDASRLDQFASVTSARLSADEVVLLEVEPLEQTACDCWHRPTSVTHTDVA